MIHTITHTGESNHIIRVVGVYVSATGISDDDTHINPHRGIEVLSTKCSVSDDTHDNPYRGEILFM